MPRLSSSFTDRCAVIIRRVLLLALFSFANAAGAEKAVFAGGCFWCVEAAFQDLEGVIAAVSGFTGGELENPTYDGNHAGHLEAVEVSFDPAVVSYERLLDIFWRNIDPFDDGGQFCDRGESYRSAIFVSDPQVTGALASMNQVVIRFPGRKVHTEIRKQDTFYPVEAHHQDYYRKNPIRYRFYRSGCGRDARLREIWGDDAGH